MEVCIIGSGFYGIMSAKIALEKGLVPVVISRDPRPGGLWNAFPGRIGPWASMTCNGSKYLFTYSDHLWDKNDDPHPSYQQVINYLNTYIEKHNLLQYFIFDSEVVNISQHEEDYKIQWKTYSILTEKVFKYVVVAAGKFSKEIQPFKSIENYEGLVVKSGTYREPSVFAGKKVLAVGRGFSSCDIAYDALSTANEVTQLVRSPYGVAEFFFNGIPMDLIICNINSFNDEVSVLPTVESNHAIMKIILSIFGNPSKWHPYWDVDLENLQCQIKTVAHKREYLEAVKSNQIKMIKGSMEDFYEHGVVLTDGRQVEADVVVLGIGYQMDLNFLSEGIKSIIRYDQNNQDVPFIGYRRTFHPALPRICFLGAFAGFVPCKFELIAEMGLRYITNTLDLTEEQILQGIRDDEYCRDHLHGATFSYNQQPFIYELMKTLGIHLDMDFIRNELKFANGPLLSQFLYLDRPGMKDLAREIVAEIKENFPHYSFE